MEMTDSTTTLSTGENVTPSSIDTFGSDEDHPKNDTASSTTTGTKTGTTNGSIRTPPWQRRFIHESVPITIWLEVWTYLSLLEGRYLCQTCHYLWNMSSTFELRRRRVIIHNKTRVNAIASTTTTTTTTTSITTNATNQIQVELRCLMYPPICSNWNNVILLHLSNFATNKILFALQNQLPNLQELYMNGSGSSGTSTGSRSDSDLSDIGLLSLMMTDNPVNALDETFTSRQIKSVPLDMARCRTLRYIDITECSCISYFVTILLREQLQHPDLIIRRIPQWMEGHYDTAYPNDGIHTYYADGSFLYDRSSCNCGYVCDLWKWTSQQPLQSSTTYDQPQSSVSGDEDDDQAVYGDCLRFINAEAPEHFRWPKLFDDLFYPGVTLSRFYNDGTDSERHTDDGVPNTRTTNQDDGSVIVVQKIDGIILPAQSYRYPIFQNAPNSVLQPGISMYRDAEGNILSTNTSQAVYRVTRMQKFPLDDETHCNICSKGNISDPQLQQSSNQRNSSMPPDHVVAAIQMSEQIRMIDNISIGPHDPYWADDRGLRASIGHVNQALFRRQPDMESSDQFVRMIRRQKRMLYL